MGEILELKNMIVFFVNSYSDMKSSILLIFWFCYSYTCNTFQFLECRSAKHSESEAPSLHSISLDEYWKRA